MMYKLVIFDMDGVIFQNDSFWDMMHTKYDSVKVGMKLTKKYLEKDTKKLADEVIGKLWAGKSADGYFELVNDSEYNPGVKEAVAEFRRNGIKTAILTSGPIHLAERAQKDLHIDKIWGNELVIKDGVLTGEYNWLSLDFEHKGEFVRKICKEFGVHPSETVVVGDNKQDVSKAKVAGLSIAFNSKSEELKKACDVVIDGNDLRKIVEHIIE